MAKKKRTYSTRFIKDNYPYTVEQIADLFGIDVATVRRWINEEGLVRIPKTRPFLIHSSALRKFLTKKKAKRKQSCKAHEAYCCKCKAPRTPKSGTGKAFKIPNGTIRFQGRCATCNTRINRAIKGTEWDEKHSLFAYLSDATKQHNRKYSTPLKCQLQGDGQLCLNLMP